METDEDANSNEHAATQRAEQTGRRPLVWSREETQYMLRMYKKNINDIGPDKKFRSKLHFWNDIMKHLNKSFQMNRTTVQCIGRFKTLQRKNLNGSNNNRLLKSSVALNELSSSDDDAEMREPSDTDQPLEIAEVIRSTLLEIHKLKEEAKERRHRERMNLLERILHKESINPKVTAQAEAELVQNKNEEVTCPTDLAVQQPSENDNQVMRARLLEMQRKKMEDRERKQRVSMAPKHQRLSVRNLK